MDYIKIIRLPNLLMVVLLQGIIQFWVLPVYDQGGFLNLSQFVLLVFTTVAIAAGGYVINDLYDTKADLINKPSKAVVGITLSRKRAQHYYYILSGFGMAAGIVFSILVGKPVITLLFFGILVLLNYYASQFKKRALIGNLLVSYLIAQVIVIFPIVRLALTENVKMPFQNPGDQFILYVAIFAGLLTLLRELVKDLEDVKGDHNAGYKTLPIILGIERTAQLSASLGLASVFSLAFITFSAMRGAFMLQAGIVVGVIVPLAYVSSHLWTARAKEQFSRSSRYLKLIMLIGVLLIPFIAQQLAYAQG